MIKTLKMMPVSAQIGSFMVVTVIFAGLFAPWLAPYGETEIVGDVWQAYGPDFLLGTDHLGRDLLSRLVFATRNTVSIALLISVISFFLGMTTGFSAAALGGWFDQIFSRIVDILMAIPILIFALMILSLVGTSIPVLIVVVSVLDSTRVFRIARAVAMDIEVIEFVEAARLRGEGLWWIIRHEILPNALPPLVAEFGLRFCFVVLFISSLSFLGLGIQPPTADWGGMVRENAGAITFGIFVPLWPAGAISFLTVGVNLIVDWFLHGQSKVGIKDN